MTAKFSLIPSTSSEAHVDDELPIAATPVKRKPTKKNAQLEKKESELTNHVNVKAHVCCSHFVRGLKNNVVEHETVQ